MKKNILTYAILVISVLLAASDLVQKTDYSPDDTYIYLQYARNFAAGNGFAFNAGEPSYGVTSPVWSMLLAPAFIFHLDAYWYSKFLDFIFLILGTFVFYKLSGLVLSKYVDEPDRLFTLRILSVSFFLLNSWFLRWSFTGMETSFAVFLAVFAMCCVYNKRVLLASAVLGVMFFVRPESFVFAGLVFIYFAFTKAGPKKIILGIVIYALIAGAFLFYAWNSFGTVFPNTTLGKATFSFGLQTYAAEVKRIFQTLAASSIIEIVLSLGFIFILLRKKKLSEDVLLIAWPISLVILYVVTDADIISRYLLIITPFITLSGIAFLATIRKNSLFPALILFVLIAVQSQFVFYKYVKPHTDNFSYGVKNCFREVAAWLQNNSQPNARVLVNDVGAIGFYSNRYIIDAAALVNRDLDLNKKIMATPVEERESTANLLKFVKADYLIQRDSKQGNDLKNTGDYKLEFVKEYEFPSLGISDPKPTYYKIYKVSPLN